MTDVFASVRELKTVFVRDEYSKIGKIAVIIRCFIQKLMVRKKKSVFHRRADGVGYNPLPGHRTEPARSLLVGCHIANPTSPAHSNQQSTRIIRQRRFFRVEED